MHARVREALERHALSHRLWEHRLAPHPIRSPADFSAYAGIPIERIAKTLFLSVTGVAAPSVLVVCPMTARLDLPAIAGLLGATAVTMGSRQALAEQLGYHPNGVSPIGAGSIPVLMDEAVFAHPTIAVGAGEAGVEVEVEPQALATMISARRCRCT